MSNGGKHNVPAQKVAELNTLSDEKGIQSYISVFCNEMENKKKKCKFI